MGVGGRPYRIWDANLRVPLYQDRSDARLIANLVKNTIDEGWYQTNPHLGAPFGQELYDFPHGGETWQLGIIKFLSLFIKDYGLLMNVYYLAGFGLTAGVTYLVLRHLRFSYWAAAVFALVYTFLPFHFHHEQSHMFRSSYWYAPIACLVLLWAMQWRERFLVDPNPPSGPSRWDTLGVEPAPQPPAPAGPGGGGHVRAAGRDRDDDDQLHDGAARAHRADRRAPPPRAGPAARERRG